MVVAALAVFAAIVAIATWGVVNVALTSTTMVTGYGMGDARTLILRVWSGRDASCRLLEKIEADRQVRVMVNCLNLQIGASTAAAYLHEVTAPLDGPLGGRSVIDGSTGEPVPLERCRDPECKEPYPWPAASAAPTP